MMVWQRAFRFTFRLWYGESTSKPFNFAIPFNYSQIHTPQGLHPTVPPDFGTAEIHNWIKRKRAFGVSDWLRKPLFYAFFGGFYPGEGFFYCIKISRNIDLSCGSSGMLIASIRNIDDAYSPAIHEEDIHPTAKKVIRPTNDLLPSLANQQIC